VSSRGKQPEVSSRGSSQRRAAEGAAEVSSRDDAEEEKEGQQDKTKDHSQRFGKKLLFIKVINPIFHRSLDYDQ